MAIRLSSAVMHGRLVDVPKFRAQMIAQLAVGSCDCGGRAYATSFDPIRCGQLWWITARCDRCAAEAAKAAKPVTTAALSAAA